MTEPSSIFLQTHELIGDGGESIELENTSLISTQSVTSPSGPTTPFLSMSNYDLSAPNVLLNGTFSTGTFTSWTNTNSSVIAGNYPGLQYVARINNLGSISQVVTGFAGKNSVVSFWHYGPQVICTLELDNNSNALVASRVLVFKATNVWLKCNIGVYGMALTGTKSKITLYSDNDNCLVTNIAMFKVDDYVNLNIGDGYNDNRDVVSIFGRKLFLGNSSEIISTRPEGADFRTDMFVKGNLTVNGTINSSILYGPPGSQSWATNIVFNSDSQTQVSWGSGTIQTLDTTTYGISGSNTGTMAALTYIYLDLDVSASVLQITTVYSTAIGNRKILIASAKNATTGNASFKVFSGQQNVINGSSQIAQASIVNGNLAANSVNANNIVANTITAAQIAANTITAAQILAGTITATQLTITSLDALTATMGNLTVDKLLTMSGATSAITIGTTPPTSTGGGVGQAGLWIDRTGIYSISGITQNATLTSAGLSAGGGNFIANATGLYLTITSSYSSLAQINFWNGSVNGAFIGVQDDTFFGTLNLTVDFSSTGPNKSEPARILLNAKSKAGYSALIQLDATQESGSEAFFSLYNDHVQSNVPNFNIGPSSFSSKALNISDVSANTYVSFQSAGVERWAIGVKGSDAGQFTFDCASVQKVVITTDGLFGIGGTPSSQAIFHVISTTYGSIPWPRMTTAQMNATTPGADGYTVFNITTHHPNYYNGSVWVQI
jgi:hypothetical protein